MSPARRRRSRARVTGPAVELVVRDGIAWMTLARPATRNRLDAEMMTALVEACAEAEDAADAGVVVVAARGAAFSSGLPPGCAWPEARWPDGVGAVAGLTKPVIGALQGDALGWGLSLALACDLRVAARPARLGLPELSRGHLPGGGAMARLARVVGVGRALDMTLLGTAVAAPVAARWGLVTTVVDRGGVARATAGVARALAARGPLALRLAKEAVVRALDLPLAEGIRLEQDLYVLLQTTADREEGIRAFLARRPPRFGGR